MTCVVWQDIRNYAEKFEQMRKEEFKHASEMLRWHLVAFLVLGYPE
jgi:hypothetical protein